ncbi:MAG TPA: glycine cleavage system protein H [Bacteroidota bacterium]|nr:glycine cleavage system protein H [Bacteroidota bacterium]
MTAIIIAIAWNLGQVIFLGIFFAIVAIIVVTLAASTIRTMRIVKENKTDAVRWESEFHDLTPVSRTCRHELTGEFKHRVCNNGFDCNTCESHAKLLARTPAESAPSQVQTAAGFAVPLDRLYHRGHTWAKPETDGTFTIGIDDFASRLVGSPEGVELPALGTRIAMNGTAWNFLKGGTSTRFLSPIDGEVIETSNGAEGWFLRVKPVRGEVKTGHLLKGREVGAWIEREFARLQQLLSDPQVGVTLPDGGMAVQDIAGAYPDKNWEAIYSTLLLEP